MTVEDRLVELELRFLSQQDEIEKLSGVVYDQQKQIDRLERELHRLRELVASEPWAEGSMPHEKPPHY